MTIRRYTPLTASRARRDPVTPQLRIRVLQRDGRCVGRQLSFPVECYGPLELDHVRSGGMGVKSASELGNLVALCSACHRWKTEHGREARVLLVAYLAEVEGVPA